MYETKLYQISPWRAKLIAEMESKLKEYERNLWSSITRGRSRNITPSDSDNATARRNFFENRKRFLMIESLVRVKMAPNTPIATETINEL